MEMKPSDSYRLRADEAINSAKDALKNEHSETAVSRAYYACFYAIHSRLEEMGDVAGSHKQVGILFRKYFIKTGLLDKKYSVILRELSDWRMDADYSPLPEISSEKAHDLIAKAEDFVKKIIAIKLNEIASP